MEIIENNCFCECLALGVFQLERTYSLLTCMVCSLGNTELVLGKHFIKILTQCFSKGINTASAGIWEHLEVGVFPCWNDYRVLLHLMSRQISSVLQDSWTVNTTALKAEGLHYMAHFWILELTDYLYSSFFLFMVFTV